MAHALETYHVADDSELARLLERAGATPFRIETNGVVYRVTREDELQPDYDPARVQAAVQASAGILTPEEGEALKAYISRAREEGTRPSSRP